MAGGAHEAITSCPSCRVEVPATAVFCPHCGSSTIPSRATTPVLQGYTIQRILGRGGAAVVYLAMQESLDRRVAVKVLRRDVEDPKVWREFRREAHTIARLSSHPHVVTVYTAGRSAIGQPYLVTEFLDRGSLGDAIAADGPMRPVEVASIGVAVANALTVAHEAGILHRDVKPGNVLLGHDGRIKLGDFGIARLLVGQSAATTDQIAFTPEHVAPEVLRNEPDGPWSDVYGLASTLATALIGAPPLQQRPAEGMQAFLARKVLAPPPVLDAHVPTVLSGPITRALDPQPSRRPSVTEFRDQLAEAAVSLGRPVPLPPPAPPVAHTPASSPSRAPETVTSRTDPPAAARSASEVRRTRRETFPVLVSVLFAVLAAVAGAIMLLTTDDGREEASTTTVATAVPPATVAGSPVPAPPASLLPVTAPATSLAPAPTPPSTQSPPTTVTPSPAVAPSPVDVSAVAPSTAVPASPLPTDQAALPPDPIDAVVTAARADAFLRTYYDAVEEGDYEQAWSQLTPEFQRGKARSYDYYVGFWDDNDIAVGDIVLVDAAAGRAIVDAELRWNGSNTASTSRFELRASSGGLLIAAQETLDE